MSSRPGYLGRRARLPVVLLAACSSLAWPGLAAAAPQAAATLYSGGPILTMAGPTPSYAEALVERGGQIRYVGSLAGALAAAGPGVRRFDLAGHALLPGFIDAHGHLPDYVATWGRPDLSPPPVGQTRSIPELQATVRAYLAAQPADRKSVV